MSNLALVLNSELQHYIKICLGIFFVMGRWLSVTGSSLIPLVSAELGSLGLSLEKGAWLGKFLDGVGVDGVGAEIPFFAVFCSFPRGRRLRDNRQQLPGNVQKTLTFLETKNNKTNAKNEEKRKQKRSNPNPPPPKENEGKAENKNKIKKSAKHTSKMQTRQRNKQNEEIYSNPIYIKGR